MCYNKTDHQQFEMSKVTPETCYSTLLSRGGVSKRPQLQAISGPPTMFFWIIEPCLETTLFDNKSYVMSVPHKEDQHQDMYACLCAKNARSFQI